MIIDESFNSDKLIEFLQALIQDAGKKVFLVLDNLRVHHSKPVKAWVWSRQREAKRKGGVLSVTRRPPAMPQKGS